MLFSIFLRLRDFIDWKSRENTDITKHQNNLIVDFRDYDAVATAFRPITYRQGQVWTYQHVNSSNPQKHRLDKISPTHGITCFVLQ